MSYLSGALLIKITVCVYTHVCMYKVQFIVFAILPMTCGSYSNTRVHVYMTCLLFYCHSAGGCRGLWYIPDLRDGLDLVKTLDPYDESAVKMTPCECYQYTSCHYAKVWQGTSIMHVDFSRVCIQCSQYSN